MKIFQTIAISIFLSILCCLSLPAQQVTFTNAANSMGIQHTYVFSGLWGGGVSFCDFDNDGKDDLTFASGIGELIYAYKNETSQFNHITNQWNITDTYESETVLWVDYDNDGDKDLFISNFNGITKLYHNSGNMNFTDITATAGFPQENLQFSAACWADYNKDGFIDVYITNRTYGLPNRLYKNEGDGTFTDVTTASGVGDPDRSPLAVSFLDYDNDGWQDIYIANDRGHVHGGNTLFRNLGDGTFQNVSAASQTDLRYDAMGIAIGDYDNNGFLDMYVSNGPEGNGLLKNNGDGTFTEVADSLGIAVNKICWGVSFFDYDNDSDMDLYTCASGGALGKKNEFFINDGNGGFSLASGIGLDNDNYESYASAIGDVNNDGYCDIAVLNQTEPSALWLNSGGNNNWIKLLLEGTTSNRDAVGALVKIYWNGQHIIRSTHCSISYLSQDSQYLTVGIGSSTAIDSLVITWPNDLVETVTNVPINQISYIVEGSGLTGIGGQQQHIPEKIRLFANYPNPFNPETTIRYELSTPAEVELSIFNIHGKKVKTLVRQSQGNGSYSATWDGTDQFGESVSSGVYLYRLSAGVERRSAKMILLR